MDSGRRLEAIDTRMVFRVYAAVAGLAGFVLFAWGQVWLGSDLAGEPWAKAALIRVFGSIVMAAACCAVGFAAAEPRPARRRALFWFAVGHSVVGLAVFSQQIAIWGPGVAEQAVQLLFAVSLGLFYLWMTSEGEFVRGTLISLFGGTIPDSAERLRSQYEQQIRQAVRLEERNRLARDLHDSIKQQVFVIHTAAATAQARFDDDSAGAREALEQVRSSAREAMTELHVMLDQLRAEPLENAGLVAALRKQCEALGFRTGAQVEFKLGKLAPSEALPPGAQQAILRVAQEALANVGRHARASHVTVALDSALRSVELKIQDDGTGFDPNRSDRGLGLANMYARAGEFGGKFELVSRPGGGTSVRFSIPCESAEAPRWYRSRAAAWGVLLLISMLLLVRNQGIFMAGQFVIAAIAVARYAVAYRRARKLSEATR